MHVLTRAQREAIFAVWRRDNEDTFKPCRPAARREARRSYRRFRAMGYYSGMNGCFMLPWRGMWLGIESDGHTHS